MVATPDCVLNAKRQPEGCRFFIHFTLLLKRFQYNASRQIWPPFSYSSSKKSVVPAITHKKASLTKSDKIM
ncbi:hypothetical protein CO700_16955 [Citrobacter koseri]|nr:hypothetical protein CO700_16955 [Citrobacter koseri]